MPSGDTPSLAGTLRTVELILTRFPGPGIPLPNWPRSPQAPRAPTARPQDRPHEATAPTAHAGNPRRPMTNRFSSFPLNSVNNLSSAMVSGTVSQNAAWMVVGIIAILIGILSYCIYRNKYAVYSRISCTEDLPEKFAGMKLSGVVTGISDGDGFIFFHCPWFRSTQHALKDKKLHVRLAGIDAPEMGYSDKPEQPFAMESMDYLKSLILRKRIEIKVVGKDLYNRILAFAYIPGWFEDTNVNLEMVKNGYACVYAGRDTKYDEYFFTLKSLTEKAKMEKRGIWMFPNPETLMRSSSCLINSVNSLSWTMSFGTFSQNAAWMVVGIIAILIGIFSYYTYWKKYTLYSRISRIEDLPENCTGMRLYGDVFKISDGDGFRFRHFPWLESRICTSEDGMLPVRLAGIDAPEMGNINMPEQPFAQVSKEYLRSLIEGEEIKIKVLGKDQYNRILAFAYLPGWFLKPFLNTWFPIDFPVWFQSDFLYTNVNLEMVKKGFACVYTGGGAKYDKYEETLKNLEEKAKRGKKGMWIIPNLVLPMEHKKIHK